MKKFKDFLEVIEKIMAILVSMATLYQLLKGLFWSPVVKNFKY